MKTSSIQKMGLAVYLLCAWLISTSAIAQAPARRVSLRERNPEFFKTEEARRIGDQIIAYQRCTGGWPKNIDMTRDMSQEELDAVIKEKNRRNDSTIDNNATTSQMTFLARLYRATKETRYRDAFRAGVEYLLSGQYENGGGPQFWPETRG